ncbi:retrovirus-related Pol polyprotein from transposon opus [Trichonephila clavipes]|nr:retrovirus-related Pol polyprotein from transposon opus [Trichonephila clavipes]
MAYGIRQTIMTLTTVVDLYIEGKVIATEFLVLPDAKGNKTLQEKSIYLDRNENESLKKKDILREQIEELLMQNVIERVRVSYAAPVILVPKPNGKVRLCVDYRKLNSVTKVDAHYPYPEWTIY